MHQPVVDAAGGPLHVWSADDQRVADAALGQLALELAERRHRHLGPHRPIADPGARVTPRIGMGLRPGDRRVEVVARTRGPRDHPEQVGALSTVIAEEDEYGVVVFADLLQVFDEPADVVVHVLHHAGVEFHLLAEYVAACGGKHDRIGHKPHPFGKLGAGRHDAHLDLPLQPLLAYRIPALVVFAGMPVPPVLRQVVRVVRRLVRHVGEEGLAAAAVGIDVADQLVGVGLGRVVIVGQFLQVAPVLGEERLRHGGGDVRHVPVAAAAVEQREVALEAARARDLVGLLAHVPLADHVGVVAGILQQLRHRDDTVVEITLVPGHARLVGRDPLVHVAQAVEVRIDAAEQHRARGRAARVRVEIREAHALAGERIEVRRPDLAAERAHVSEAHVVGKDDDDVRPAGAVCGRCHVREKVCRDHANETENSRQPLPAGRLSARCTR